MSDEDRIPTFDSGNAKIIAYIVVFGFIAIMLVFGIKYSGDTIVHKGDKKQSIVCKWCQGLGQVEEERCKHCLGAKKVKAIIPGPNHPLRIRGSVRDLSAFESKEEAASVALADADYSKVVLKPMRGAVGGAKLQFLKGEDKTEIVSKPSGRYHGFLPPGEYRLVIEEPGFQNYSQDYVVPVREHPIWPKMPGIELEDEDQLEMEIVLERE